MHRLGMLSSWFCGSAWFQPATMLPREIKIKEPVFHIQHRPAWERSERPHGPGHSGRRYISLLSDWSGSREIKLWCRSWGFSGHYCHCRSVWVFFLFPFQGYSPDLPVLGTHNTLQGLLRAPSTIPTVAAEPCTWRNEGVLRLILKGVVVFLSSLFLFVVILFFF